MTEGDRELSRRQFLRLAGALTLGIALASCDNNPTRKVDPTAVPSGTPAKTPEATPTTGVIQEGEQGLEANLKVEQTEKTPAIIEVGVWYERDSEDPTIERIKFALPENLTEGDNPAINEGDSVVIGFFVDTEVPFKKVIISPNNVFGFEVDSEIGSEEKDASGVWGGWVLNDFKLGLNAVDAGGKRVHTIDDPNKVLEKILITGGPVGDRQLVRFELPNQSYYYEDEEMNPYKRFSEGKMVLELRRMDKVDEDVVIGPLPPITISGLEIGNGGEIVAQCPYELEVREPIVIKIQSDSDTDNSPQIVVQNETSQAIPTGVEVRSRWTQTDWQENETVSLREWFNDMEQQGLIIVDPVAQQYAGDRIVSFVKDHDLVPNPKEYWSKGLPFSGNCTSVLDDIVQSSQGHIIVSPEAYRQIPGGFECQVFAKSQ